MPTPTVSVIIPNFNHGKFLADRFESVIQQTFSDLEIILLDDCSTDESNAVLSKLAQHPKVTAYVQNEKNSGSPFRQWNVGINKAKGRFIWIAESDDYAKPTFLESLVPLMVRSPKAVLGATPSIYMGTDGTLDDIAGINEPFGSQMLTPNTSLISGKEFIWRYMQQGNGLQNASAIVIRNHPQVLSSIPTDMRYCGDWVTWIRLLKKGDLIYCHEPLNHWRIHPQTTRWENKESSRAGSFFWESVDRPEYMREMLVAMLELRSIAGLRWNTFVFSGMLRHYARIAGEPAYKSFLSSISVVARTHLFLKNALRRYPKIAPTL